MFITRWITEKRDYRRYQARRDRLPDSYRQALHAVERYVYVVGTGNAVQLLSLLDDLADLFEQSAANATPIADVVGEDPVEFAEAFIRNYPDPAWIAREREQLRRAVASIPPGPDLADGSPASP